MSHDGGHLLRVQYCNLMACSPPNAELDAATGIRVVLRRLDLRDIRVVCKLGGTIDDSELVSGFVFDQKVW